MLKTRTGTHILQTETNDKNYDNNIYNYIFYYNPCNIQMLHIPLLTMLLNSAEDGREVPLHN